MDEGVGGREAFGVREDVLGDGEEDRGVFAEDGDVEDFLGVVESEMCELGVQSRVLGSKVGNAKRS